MQSSYLRGATVGLMLLANAVIAGDGSPSADGGGVLARVAGEVITLEQFHAYFAEQMRKRFYHGRASEDQISGLEGEVLQQLADRILLRREALKRGIEVDDKAIDNALSEWVQQKGGAVPDAVKLGERQARVDLAYADAVKKQFDDAQVDVSDSEQVAYYEANKDKFTRPEQLKLSLILLKVAPYEQPPVWQVNYDKAQELLVRLGKGESFAAVAREYSQHESASQGGDLGFVHAGMLSSEVQEIVNKLKVGDAVDKPVVLLQGVALLRLDGKKEAELQDYVRAKDRVKTLLLNEKRKKNWEALLVKLRNDNPIEMLAQ